MVRPNDAHIPERSPSGNHSRQLLMYQADVHHAVQPGLKLNLLGEFRIVSDAGQIDSTIWRRRLRAGQLLMLLALAPRQMMHKEEVVEHLWPGQRQDAALNNLRVARHKARKTVRDLVPDTRQIVASEGSQLILCQTGPVWTDVGAFESAASLARTTDDRDILDAAIALYRGDLLPEQQYEEWTISRRNALQQTCLQLLIQLAELLNPRSELERILALLDRALTIDASYEQAFLSRMRAYGIVGQIDKALGEYRQLQHVMELHLGLEPSPAARKLFDSIQSGSFTDSQPPPPVRLVLPEKKREPRHNLPVDLTRFIGRSIEIAEVKSLIRSHRLVSVTGPGGSGKTRIAIRASSELVDEFPHGAWLVQLASVNDRNLVVPAIAAALDVREVPGTPLRDRLLSHLSNQKLLLILDNCEHLIETCARFAEDALRTCPKIYLLSTTREVLRVDSEVTWTTPPLSLPAIDGGRLDVDPDTLSESVELFVDRARLDRESFWSSSETIAGVAEICHRLEGMPLAIELAAARTSVLTIPEIVDRLDDALGLLGHASRSAPARHQTLRATLAWSYELLHSRERRLFRSLSVFPGGFDLQAATHVATGGDQQEMTVIDGIASLSDKSLLVKAIARDGRTRFRQLETVRQFGYERLSENGEDQQAERLLISWYEPILHLANDALVGPDQVKWLEWLETEHDNLRHVLNLCIRNCLSVSTFNVIWGMWRYWEARGHLEEGRGWIEQALEIDDRDAFGLERARVLLALGILRRRQGDTNGLEPILEECLAISRDVEDDEIIMAALTQLGHLARERADYGQAMTYYEETLRVRTSLGDYWGMTVSCAGLGQTAMLRGDLHAAEQWYRRSLEIRQQLEDHTGIARALGQLGEVARARGDSDLAQKRLDQSLVLYREVGNPLGASTVLANLSCLAIERGNREAARICLSEAVTLVRDVGAEREIINLVAHVVETLLSHELFCEAVQLLSAVEQFSELRGISRSSHDRDRFERQRECARISLGDTRFEECWSAAHSVSFENAIDEALR